MSFRYIFGSSGFVGKHLVSYFSSLYPSDVLYCFDLFPPDKESSGNFIQADVRNTITFNAGQGGGVIYNLAAVHRVPGHNAEEYFNTNVCGARNVCSFAEANNIKNIVFISSIAVYGASEKIASEDSVEMPEIPYGISKYMAERIHIEWAMKDASRKLTILRPAVVFGVGERGNFDRLFRQINRGFFVYPGRKDTVKSCIYIKDLIRYIDEVHLIQENKIDIFNACYKERTTLEVIVNVFVNILNKNTITFTMPLIFMKLIIMSFRIIFRNTRSSFHPDRIIKLIRSTNISSEKLNRLGFYPKYSLDEAIRDWLKEKNVLK